MGKRRDHISASLPPPGSPNASAGLEVLGLRRGRALSRDWLGGARGRRAAT